MEEQLIKIRQARRDVFFPKGKTLYLLISCFVFGLIYKPIGIVLGIIFMYSLFERIKYTAHLPCPKCGEPFGTKNSFPLGVGGMVCQNCGLSLYVPEQ